MSYILDALKRADAERERGTVPGLRAQTVPGVTEILSIGGHVLQYQIQVNPKAGMTFANVVKCSVFVTDIGMFGRINEVYARYFPAENAPARELVQVVALPKNVNVEISAIAQVF